MRAVNVVVSLDGRRHAVRDGDADTLCGEGVHPRWAWEMLRTMDPDVAILTCRTCARALGLLQRA